VENGNRYWKMENRKKPLRTFQDLDVYQNLYRAMLIVLKNVIPKLPKEERFDLVDQARRACKAPPAILAEGFAKRYQKKAWGKYIDDTIGECYETINHLSVCIDVYGKYVDLKLCNEAINLYIISCKQLTNLKKSWRNYHDR
jgi:four helix bundle protein